MNFRALTEEEARLFALERYRKFYERKESELRELVGLAAQLCNVPIAAISLVGKEYQHMIAAQGIDLKVMPRQDSFCNQAIKNNAFTHISDALADPLYADLPTVREDPNLRFYASSNLVSPDGFPLGTLCVLDTKPATLTDSQIRGLKALAQQICQVIELEFSLDSLHQRVEVIQKQQIELETTKAVLRAILDSSGAHHILLNRKFNILACNKGVAKFYEKICGKEMKVGSNIFDFIPERYRDRSEKVFQAAFDGEEMEVERLLELESGVPVWWDIRISPARSITGAVIGVSVHAIDIHTQKTYYEQVSRQNEHLRKIAFIQAHEVRGPLASILGLINLIRSENAPAGSEYFDLLEQASGQLDSRISEIINLSNKAEASTEHT